MEDGIHPKESSLHQLNDELYNPKKRFGQRQRRSIHGHTKEFDHDFSGQEDEDIHTLKQRELPKSFFKKIFIAVAIFFLAAVAIALLSLYENKKTVSNDRISMEILGQPFVDSGEDFEIQVRIQNFNDRKLMLPDLVLSYPKDSALDAEPVFLRHSLEDIESGKQAIESFDIRLFGQEGDLRNMRAVLEYRIEGSSSIFTKEADHELIIRSTPTQLSVEGPEELLPNQQITLQFEVHANTQEAIDDALLHVEYPRGFELISADPAPSYGDNRWYFPSVDNEKQYIVLTGRISAFEGQGQSFHVEFGKQDPELKNSLETIFNALVHTVYTTESFISTQLIVNQELDDLLLVRGGEGLRAELHYTNALDLALKDLAFDIELKGDLFDPYTVDAQSGFYASNEQTIIFDGTTKASLKSLEPGASGTLYFNLGTRDLVSQFGILNNPEMIFSVNMSARDTNGELYEAKDITQLRVIANSDIQVIPTVNYIDGAFENSGPLPPRVGIATSYTLRFQVTNSSNDLDNARVSTILPPYVTWMNQIAPSVERNKVSYNTNTRELVWEIGSVKAGLGVGTTSPKQLSFQVKLLPSLSQVGSYPNLTGDIIFEAKDRFTDADLRYKKTAISSRLVNDGGQSNIDGRVQP